MTPWPTPSLSEDDWRRYGELEAENRRLREAVNRAAHALAIVIAPVLIFDSRERWFPVGVEESLALFGYKWDVANRTWYHEDDEGVEKVPPRLDFPEDMKQPDLPPVGYLERINGHHVDWLRYHVFLLDNPGPRVFRGLGRHRGDWEMVQIGVDKHDGTPLVVTLSQHGHAQSRKTWAPKAQCDIGTRPDGSTYLRVYVGLGSHANYFTKGDNGIGDECDGKGRHVTPEWRAAEDQPWWKWKGRWGGDDSPKSPGLQRQDPDLYDLLAKS